MKAIWIYVNTNKQFGDPEHIKVFATTDHLGGGASPARDGIAVGSLHRVTAHGI